MKKKFTIVITILFISLKILLSAGCSVESCEERNQSELDAQNARYIEGSEFVDDQ